LKTNLAAHKTKVSAMTIHFNLCKLIKAKKENIFSHFHSSQKNHSATVENSGEGVAQIFAKIGRGGGGVSAY
jgi:hypothetical protein